MKCENCEKLESLVKKFQEIADKSHQVLVEGIMLGKGQAREFDEVWSLVEDEKRGLPVLRKILKSPWVSGDEGIAIIDSIMAAFMDKRNLALAANAAMAKKLASIRPDGALSALRQVMIDHQMKRISLPNETLGLISAALFGKEESNGSGPREV